MEKKIFKYVFMLMIVLMGAVTISSCGKDDDTEASTEVSICGSWKCVSADYRGLTPGPDDETTLPGDMLYLNEDYTFKTVGHENTSGKWKKEDNKLIMTVDKVSWTYTITECTNSKLTIVADLFGFTVSYTRI